MDYAERAQAALAWLARAFLAAREEKDEGEQVCAKCNREGRIICECAAREGTS